MPAAAEGKFNASTSLQTSAGKTRIVVVLTSTKKLKKKQKPKGVSAKAGGKTYRLSKVGGSATSAAGARASKTYGAGTWRSAAYDSASLAGLAGQRITVIVRTKKGRSSVGSTVAGGGGGGGGGGPLFQLPAQELTGNDAVNAFSKYFLNSRFTDCPGVGWPACAVEERYVHCPTGAWEYHRYTNVSGADINSYGSFQVTGAASHPNGSWGVEYVVTAYGSQSFYSWNVTADGTITGIYRFGDSQQQLGPLKWQQPAGGC